MKSWMRNTFEIMRHSFARILHRPSGLTQPFILENRPAAVQLRSIITTAKEQAEGAQATLGDISSDLQRVIDGADVTLPLAPYMNPAGIGESCILWDDIARQACTLRGSLDKFKFTLSSTASLSAASTSGMFPPHIIPFLEDQVFKYALTQFNVFASRPAIKAEVIKFMNLFHLDISPSGKHSPLELFETAYRAFEVPVSKGNPVITSLIPMREAIESALDELLKLRPHEEPVARSHGKIQSICAQLKKDTVSDVIVQEWANQWHDISDHDLSVAKQYRMGREEWGHKLNRATLFLNSLLTGLDQSKLRM